MTRLSIYILLLGIYVETIGGQQPFTARLLYISPKLGFGPLGINKNVPRPTSCFPIQLRSYKDILFSNPVEILYVEDLVNVYL